MANNLPSYFIEEIRVEIFDSTAYTNNEIAEFARRNILRLSPFIQQNVAIDTTNVWDFIVTGVDSTDAWEVYKLGTVVDLTKDYYRKQIAQGVGVSLGIGAERIDTKTILIGIKDEIRILEKRLKEKILQYNLIHVQGSNIDVFYNDPTT